MIVIANALLKYIHIHLKICQLMDQGIRKCGIYTYIHMAYCLAIKKLGILSFAGKWMKPEDIVLREICQTQKDKHLMFFYHVWK